MLQNREEIDLTILSTVFLGHRHGSAKSRTSSAHTMSRADRWRKSKGGEIPLSFCIRHRSNKLSRQTNFFLAVHRLERCAATSLRWANDSAVCFETSKAEAVLFSRKRKHWQQRGEKTIWAGDQTVRFAKESTRWSSIRPDPAPTLRENR